MIPEIPKIFIFLSTNIYLLLELRNTMIPCNTNTCAKKGDNINLTIAGFVVLERKCEKPSELFEEHSHEKDKCVWSRNKGAYMEALGKTDRPYFRFIIIIAQHLTLFFVFNRKLVSVHLSFNLRTTV
jgi:hypothetical protein